MVGEQPARVPPAAGAGIGSGEMLDYVYENEPRGRGPLGRWIDRVYLNSVGWRGIRARRLS